MTKMKKLLATAALTAGSAAALAAPAHADARGHWTATGTAACAGNLLVVPMVKSASPLPLGNPVPACPADSLIHGHS